MKEWVWHDPCSVVGHADLSCNSSARRGSVDRARRCTDSRTSRSIFSRVCGPIGLQIRGVGQRHTSIDVLSGNLLTDVLEMGVRIGHGSGTRYPRPIATPESEQVFVAFLVPYFLSS
jgi:hypothetical protein